MRKVHLDSVKPGDINAKAIYSYATKRCLLDAGVCVLPKYIKRLKERGVSYIYIEDKISEGIQLQTMISDELEAEVKCCVMDVMNKVKNEQSMDGMKELTEAVDKIIDTMFLTSDLKISITDIRAADDYTFAHSVSVCTLALVLGKVLGYTGIELRNLGLGAILHDIGKIKIPPEILNKPGKLTREEMEVIKKHTKEGFDLLCQHKMLSEGPAAVALGHHERYDGSGYPNGFTNGHTHIYARIVSIVDAFDAMTSDRVYRKGIEPKKVINYLKRMKDKHYEGTIVDTFIDKINMNPNGTIVTLNTKEKAIVVKSNLCEQDRPKVRIFERPTGEMYETFWEVDLATTEQYRILDNIKEG